MPSQSTVFIGWSNACQQDLLGPFGKLATLWFDKSVFQVPTDAMLSSALGGCAEHGLIDQKVVDELLRVWIPIQSFVPTYKFLESVLNPSDMSLANALWDATFQRYQREYPQETGNPGLHHEAVWAAAGMIETLAAWSVLKTQTPRSLLTTDLETEVISQVFQPAAKAPEVQCFSEIVQYLIPDLSGTPWERILELRSHTFLAQFRTKLAEVEEYVQLDKQQDARKILVELEQQGLEELARLTRPAPVRTIVKAIASSIPLPIPVNPVSVGIGIKEILEAYDRTKRFGWLYFLLDLRADRHH